MEIEHVYEALPHRSLVLDWAKTDEPIARFLSRLGSPPVIALIGIAVMAAVIGNSNGWLWALAFLILAVPLPTLYVLWKVRRGEITDFDIRVREQRVKPYVLILICTAVALVLMIVGRAPGLMIVVAAAGWVQTAILFIVTLWWKISAHCTAMAGLAVLALGTIGMAAWPLMLGLPLVAWSRVRLRRHTLRQTIAGSVLGLFVSIAAFALYRPG